MSEREEGERDDSGGNSPPTSDRVARSEKFLRNIVEHIPTMIFLKEAGELRFELFNRAGEELLGYDREEMLGKNDYDFFPEEQADFFTSKDRDVLESGEVLDIPEESVQTRHGERILHTKKVPIFDQAGNPEYLLGISMDITERKQREEALERSQRELEAVNEELEAFCYSVAHDLRAPLRAIDGFSQALQEDCADELSDQGEHYLEHVRDSAQKMAQLIDDLLELSRVTRADIRTEQVDLSTMAREIIDRFRELEPDRNVEVVIEDDLVAQGDPKLLAVVLENVLGNAWKFTRDEKVATIEFRSRVEDGRRVFFVRDDGAGFDMEYSDKLFGTFQRLHSTHEFDGTGIGLATVRRIVRKHGGEVWAEGEVGVGATLYFTLEPPEVT